MRGLIFCCMLCSAAATAIAADLAPDEIIQKFAAKEAEFRKARENYTYKQSVKMEEIDGSGNVEGKWEESRRHYLRAQQSSAKKRSSYAPMNTLAISLSRRRICRICVTFSRSF